jgi:hypothetical protein
MGPAVVRLTQTTAFRFDGNPMAVVTSSTQVRSRPAVARVMAWMAEKRTGGEQRPARIVPGILGVAEPITVPTW